MTSADREFYTITVAAQRLGVSVARLKQLEAAGIVKPRRVIDTSRALRIFTDEDLARVVAHYAEQGRGPRVLPISRSV